MEKIQSIRILIFIFCITSVSINSLAKFEKQQNLASDFYKKMLTTKTFDFTINKIKEFLPPKRLKMSIWNAIESLENIHSVFYPKLSIKKHLFLTAEAIREDKHPRWFILTGFIHCIGYILCTFGESEWLIGGLTFPVGCPLEKFRFKEFYKNNPDFKNPKYSSGTGIYQPHCGLNSVHMVWNHAEYLYHVIKDYVPEEVSYIIRYHNFLAHHQNDCYKYLLNEYDNKMLHWLKLFSQYNRKGTIDKDIDIDLLTPFYQELVNEYFAQEIYW